ncbi:serine/threonine-protein kinase SMG1 isoform X2 [Chrysoperla carnea]|uniref:serine/threonine-protein kinase SMG1 isoform X2 n=1 Tax=Chrysoperla carnea TaxID=189513 RepID=UPI001D06C2FB|nr:serine/threonine-protein kinase SMG1 isoform X2 [Chrysoperla carnea]
MQVLQGPGGRQNENDRRSTTRDRGGKIFSYSRISDYRTPRTKFQESLNRNNSNECIQHHSKHFLDMDNKNKLDSGYNNLPDDPRISKMLRKLCVETDQDRSIAICHKLLDTLMFPDNAKYIRRAFDILADTLLGIIKFGPCEDTRYLAARALGRIGYIMENDYKYFLTWLIKEFTKSRDDEIKILLIKSLIETYTLERTQSKLYDYSTLTLNNIISQVEYAERPELFMALIDVVLMITECYPNEVNSHFRDVVDILVGWLVESNHSPEMADYASRSLQRLGVHWQTNILFSIQLLAQFLEDLVAFSEAFNSSGSSTPLEYISPKIETSLNQVTALTRVINTVLKCLGTCLNPSSSSCITLQFLTDCFINIVSTATKTLDKYLPENLIIAANESAYILLGYIQSKSAQANEFLYNLIDIELSLTQDFSDATLVSMLLLISQTIKEVAANLPIELVQKLLGETSEILKLRNSPSINVQTGVVSVYHSLLNLKNIPLLQEAYRYVLGDLERSYLVLLPNLEPFCANNPMTITYSESEAEITTLFLLRCLSDLANASSSIIGMWALRPSILELLAVQLKPYSYELGLHCPSLQHAILFLLYSHCKRYNHFVSSSNLVFQSRTNVCDMLGLPLNINLGEGATSSPTSGHLTIILDVVTKTLLTQTCVETKCLILTWSKEIITLSESYYETLYQKPSFMEFTNAITQCGFDINGDIVTTVYETLSLLLSNNRAKWSTDFLTKLSDLCALHMNCVDEEIRNKYSILSTKIPWNIITFNIEKQSQLSKIKRKYKNQLPQGEYNKSVVQLAQHLHITRSGGGNIEMHTQNFKKFMSHLLFGHEHELNWLENILNSCWPLLDTTDLDDYVTYFGNLAQISYPLLIFWITFEAANFCVNNKLRTPLGKPTDTFTSIESSIKKLAREITNERKTASISLMLKENKRVRILMEFMEHLEKVIYNASEGCATAMTQPSKPVRTFFHTNASTCREWFSRIRIAITVVALHAGLSPMAIRHAQALLNDLANADNTQGVEFERAVLHLAWGYLNLNESEALQGLYVWCSNIAKRKFAWLKTAAEQASKKYENAAKAYESILESELQQNLDEKTEGGGEPNESFDKSKNDSKLLKLTFISDQITECYRKVNCWNDLAQWKLKEHDLLAKYNQNGGFNKYTLNCISSDYAQTLFEFEENDFVLLGELTKWNKTEKSCENSSWSTYSLLHDVETDLYDCVLNLQRPDVKYETYKDNLNNAVNITQVCIQEKLRNLPSEFLQNSVFLNQIATCMKNTFLGNTNGETCINICTDQNSIRQMNSNILSKILWWSECFNKVKPQNTTLDIANLRLDVARAARKEGNFNLARKQIQKFFDLKKDLYLIGESKMNQWAVLENISKTLIDYENLDVSTWSLNNARALMEAAKLLYVSHDNKELALFLCAVTSFGVSQRITMSDCSYELRERGTRMLLTLAKWVQIETNQNYVADISNPLGRFVTLIPEIGLVEQSDHTDIIPIQDMAVGKVLQFAANQCSTLAKVWFTYGSWCYRWGRKMVDHSSESGTAGGTLSESDREAIKNLMPIGTSLEDLQNVYQILSQTRAVADEDDIGSNDINTSEMIEAQLRSVPILSNAYPEHLLMLVNIWRQAQKRVYSYYDLSANAYFKYLELYSTADLLESGECTTITATLRLLRLIVKHALELQTVLESGLATTPTQPWKAIIPQLFSRLNHPEAYVRRRVSELLCRVATDAPHLITFPAVVGAVQGGVNQLEFAEMKDYLSQNDNENNDFDDLDETDKDVTNNVLNSCFMSMVETLSKQTPETITQVQLLVKELRRITLLWDELWLGTLLQHNNEIVRRLTQLEQEILKVNNNTNLTKDEKEYLVAEKHRILTKPIIFILEQLHSITSITPETPNEKLFQERFNSIIVDVIEKLKHPLNPNKPKESWQPLKVLQTKLQQRAHKRASYTLKMSDISPILAQMHDTVIAMPGLRNNNSKQLVTIMSVDNHVSILPTKTKPKKLIFHGSDGQTYTYLFKGLEDLHLDERIMQFLSIANTMLAKGSENNVYRAKHYSVIPLGPRSGLISWVDGVTPVFALYKRWQQRAATKASLKQNSSQTTVLRPSELFYNKLNPLLKEHGVKNIDNRKEWPVSVLKQVLTELMAETPDDLLARELWCHSINTGAWWQNVRNYSYSVAVMSIIGYIIGLGDRHLDNVLVDLSSGEVVHIDYNVCFEKGKTLRVPEKVPFRMTPNIRAALGVTGVEGIFRLACEHVLRTMKKGRETLLTLLEAFVYDPLVDWTVGGESVFATTVFGGSASTISTNTTKQSRRELEREVTTAMFNVRCAEMKTEWLNNKTDMENQIIVVIKNLKKWIEEYQNVQNAEEALQDLHQQMAIVKEAEANIGTGKHSLFTLPQRYQTYKRTYEAFNLAKKNLDDKIEDCEKHTKLHVVALAAIRGPQLSQWIQELNFPIDHENHLVFDLIKEFLQNAGQSSMITQCEQSEVELATLAQQQTVLIRSCLDLLSQYAAVASNYPTSSLEKHRSICYLKWCQILRDTKSVDVCHEVLAQFNSVFAPETANNPLVQQVVSFSYQLQTIVNDANLKLKKSYDRLTAEGIPDSGSRLDQTYIEAKNSIQTFLRLEKGAIKAFECVNITALCALNKRFLMMEQAAASAGDVLMDLHSMEGDWFLDEMHLMSSLVTELSNLIPVQHSGGTAGSNTSNSNKIMDDNKVSTMLNCLKTANNIYKGLQELNFNFYTIILPEAMKTIQTEEPSVIAIVNELNDLILSVGCPLSKLIGQLEIHLRFTIMQMDSPQANVQSIVAQLRSRYDAMLHSQSDDNGSTDTLTPGKMLLMGFNGLFDKLNVESNTLISTFNSLDIPSCWKKVDQYREAKALSAPIFKDQTRSVLDDIFLLKRIQTISEFFVLCGQMSCSFKGVGMATVYDDASLNKPIHRFTADYVSRQLLGVTSQIIALALCVLLQRMGLNVTNEIEQRDVGAEHKVPLEELCRKLVDTHLKRGSFTSNVLAQASGLSSTLENSWRRREIARHLQQNVEAQRTSLQRLQLQLTAHYWLHEDIIMLQPGLANLSPVIRSNFMMELRKNSSTLLGMQQRLTEAREQQRSLVSSAEQRLKWAAGANPALSDVMAAFECAVNIREDRLTLEQKLALQVGNTCSALLHHEALRTRTSEGMSHDAAFIALLNQWEQACTLLSQCTSTISSTEESLMELLPVEGNLIDASWVKKSSNMISDMIATRQQLMLLQSENVSVVRDLLKASVDSLKDLWNTHHHLMGDIRNLLKSISKNDDCCLLQGLHDYLRSYYSYSEKITAAFFALNNNNTSGSTEDLNADDVEKALHNLEDIVQLTSPIYDDLLKFKIDMTSYNTSSKVKQQQRPPLLRQDPIWQQSPRKQTAQPLQGTVVNSSGRGQQRNAYAVGVWRRVRMKLEGRDPDPGRRYTLQEQVDYVIREATNLENLALLYEGWTPWV